MTTSRASPSTVDAWNPGEHELTSGTAAARDSLRIGGWTAVSRVTGVVRVLLIAAVLGPTALGNSFQLTNTLPNLIYYGFLAGSLFSTLLVPSLVGHLQRGDFRATARVSGGLLGFALLVVLIVAPIAVIALPEALRLASIGLDASAGADQAELTQLLILLMIPQVFGYVVIGVSAAAMNARHRFVLTAAAPAIENCALIVVLVLFQILFVAGEGASDGTRGELLFLGLGSTAAVAVHMCVQWFGARRAGVMLRPLPGWRDPEVLAVVRRAVRALMQSGLIALQVLTLLLIASRVEGGIVAMQIAINFFALPIAVAATPVALSLLPRLSRLHHDGHELAFTNTFRRGIGLVLFLTVPAACGYLVLANPIADVVAVGRMDSAAAAGLVALAIASVSIGLIGEAVFFLATQASYARHDAHTPLRAMGIQAAVCLALCGFAFGVDGRPTIAVLGAAFAVANLLGAGLLVAWIERRLEPGTERLMPSIVRILVGSAAFASTAALAVAVLSGDDPGHARATIALVVACLTGLVVFGVVQLLMRTPELAWVMGGMQGRGRHRRQSRWLAEPLGPGMGDRQ
jgi:putative peptidoglycan lipid II flippase